MKRGGSPRSPRRRSKRTRDEEERIADGEQHRPPTPFTPAKAGASLAAREHGHVMSRFIDYAIGHARLTIATLLFLLSAGLVAYVTIPKEAEPDVRIPIIYVQLSQRGISPEDSERLLLRPVETQLKSVGHVKELPSTAFDAAGFSLPAFHP